MGDIAADSTDLMKSDDQFDPISNLLVAQCDRPRHVLSVNMRVLSPFQRALLVIDGTVTSFIEAYAMEPLDIERIAQERRTIGEAHLQLEMDEGATVAVRQVMIRGKYSRIIRVFATSLVVLSRLPAEIQRRLEIQGEGIGRILNDLQLENRREILWYGRERANDVPEILRDGTTKEFITRTYRIIHQQKPIALINEKFPNDSDALPSHH